MTMAFCGWIPSLKVSFFLFYLLSTTSIQPISSSSFCSSCVLPHSSLFSTHLMPTNQQQIRTHLKPSSARVTCPPTQAPLISEQAAFGPPAPMLLVGGRETEVHSLYTIAQVSPLYILLQHSPAEAYSHTHIQISLSPSLCICTHTYTHTANSLSLSVD